MIDHTIILLPYRDPEAKISENYSLYGFKGESSISSLGIDSVYKQLNLPDPDCCLLYSYLKILNKNRVVKALEFSRSRKRNNSCVLYRFNQGDSMEYGTVHKFIQFVVDSQPFYYAAIHQLVPGHVFLCQDQITCAKLNDHIISCKLRSTQQCISINNLHFFFIFSTDLFLIPVTSIFDKAVMLIKNVCI